jgi:tRNA-2-methylthio-N6-dimethylallyladenosine synthase
MGRAYTPAHVEKTVKRLRAVREDPFLACDIIAAFPGETEDDLEQTLDLMSEMKFLYAYMYHYNPREGTAAYTLQDKISEKVKKERLSRVIDLQKKHTRALLKKRIGERETVLVEGISRKNADELVTRTERDEMAVAPGPASMIGSFAVLTIAGLKGNTFRAAFERNEYATSVNE